MRRVVYRIVVNNPPSDDDLRSYAELGQKPIRADAETVRLMTGISVMGSLEAAIRKAHRRPWLSDAWIAELILADEESVRVEKTTRDPNHFTLWATPDQLRGMLGRIVRVSEDEDHAL